MITKEKIEEVKKRLIKVYQPLEIYIFGSYAWGTPNEDSDLDLAIIVDRCFPNKYEMLVEGHKALIGLKLPKDLFLYTKDEFEEYSEDSTRLTHKIKYEGKKIYAKA